MELESKTGCHLTYCSNVHPGETWNEVMNQLKKNLPELKRKLSPKKPFGVGLRLSAVAAEELLESDELNQFKEWLNNEGLYVFTMNGFPYGSFHRQRVKDHVYMPDWRTDERVEYTSNLITILAELLPENLDGGISTSPLSYKYWPVHQENGDQGKEDTYHNSSRNLAKIALEMANIRNDRGRDLHLDIEPEPDCLLENSRETIDYFLNWLLPVGGEYLSDEFGIPADESEKILRHHIRICYDTCHFSVEYEDPVRVIEKFSQAGIRIGKTQISAALKIALDKVESGTQTTELAARLKKFDEPVYLHQVVERRTDGSLKQYRDLPDALPFLSNEDAEEWRIHFHVPIFIHGFGDIRHEGEGAPGGSRITSTQDDIVKSLEFLLRQDDCRHFEIETYTWEVLPDELKSDLLVSIEREYNWVLNTVKDIA